MSWFLPLVYVYNNVRLLTCLSFLVRDRISAKAKFNPTCLCVSFSIWYSIFKNYPYCTHIT